MICSICRDYLTQIKHAMANGRYDQADAIKALYAAHLQDAHAPRVVTVDREAVRQAFGRLGQ